VVGGTTGESATLSGEELCDPEVARRVREVLAGLA
jgi:dihydrodipicolinate synthase/N-acetylneuraminate lyase